MGVYVESYLEFSKRHGENAVTVDGRLIFPSGAQADANEGIQRWEVPDDPHERLTIQKRRMRALVRRLENEFQRSQAAFIEQASLAKSYSNLPDAPSDARQILEKMRAEVHAHRAELERIERELEKTPAGIEKRIREEDRHAHQQEVSRQISDLASLSLD